MFFTSGVLYDDGAMTDMASAMAAAVTIAEEETCGVDNSGNGGDRRSG
ncbi:unnamed protein product [Camellia sinensis]